MNDAISSGKLFEQHRLLKLMYYILSDVSENPTITLMVFKDTEKGDTEISETVHEHPSPLEIAHFRDLTYLFQ